jgi:hypothetical protein
MIKNLSEDFSERTHGKPEQTVENHETLYRLSLIEGESSRATVSRAL